MTINQCNIALRTIDRAVAEETKAVMERCIHNGVGKVGDANYSKGNLERSIRIVERDGVYYVGSNLPYAKYVDRGRGSVVPIRAKTLVFKSPDGRTIRTKYAKPMQGIHFVAETKTLVQGRLRTVWQRVIERSGL